MESEQSQSQTQAGQFLLIGGQVYNRDHVVKVDARREGFVAIHHTLGVDEYSGPVAVDVAAFFGAGRPEQTQAGACATGGKKKGR